MSGIGNGGPDDNDAQAGSLVSKALTASAGPRHDTSAETLIVADTLRKHPRPGSNSDGALVAAPLASGGHPNSNVPGRRKEDDVNIVAFHSTGGGEKGLSPSEDVSPGTGTGRAGTVAVAFALRKDPGGVGQGHNTNFVADLGVRRLTPIECERLQGLPDDWTAPDELGGPGRYLPRFAGGRVWPSRHDRRHGRALLGLTARARALFAGWNHVHGVSDAARYSGLGDAVTASVAEWIGGRLADAAADEEAAA